MNRALGDSRGPIIGTSLGVLGALVLSAAMLPLRSELANVVMALVLVLPVLAGSFTGGRLAGAASAIAAALCFDFFFTHPYFSMRIANRNDIATAIALLVLALIAAEAGHRLRRRDRAARDARSAFERVCRVAELSARSGDLEDLISSARAEIMGLFDLEECLYEAAGRRSAPRVGIDGLHDGLAADRATADLVLPPGGVVLPVTGRGRDYGRLVLYTNRPVKFSVLERRVAVSIADELGVTLASQAPAPAD